MEKIYKENELGYEVRLNHFAQQADGAVWLQQGGTVVLATVVSEEAEEFPGYFPLSVDYRELFSSAGKIPGGYFKREGKPTDKEVLGSRIIDRCIRPLFPKDYFHKVSVVVTVYSLDPNCLTTSLSLVAASCALSLSKIPFMGPAGCCEVARVNGSWVVGPTNEQLLKSDVRLVVGGDEDGVNMVEGAFAGLSEKELVEAMFLAHVEIKKQVAWQRMIAGDFTVHKVQDSKFDSKIWEQRARLYLTNDRVKKLFVNDKVVRSAHQRELQVGFFDLHKHEMTEEKAAKSFVSYAFDAVLQEVITQLIFSSRHRLDGRAFDAVRPISVEVGLLPRAHGSGLFTRGRTQLLATATLGSADDELKLETLIEENAIPFMLHYNFPPFSVGEARPLRAPGRREVGHGHLAWNAVKAVLPDRKAFPYTIRVVADTLESDGSSSMATVCSSIMALMDAGVPISSMVGGTAMGMLQNTNGEFAILTDISGIEDAFGLMDFKVAGTVEKVTAIQMDIKYKGGLPRKIFEEALEAARRARLHILDKMREVLSSPRQTMSEMVPQFVTIKIPRDKIGAVIGSGGKVIREITEKTATSITIEDDGSVKIFGQKGPQGIDKAVGWIKLLSGDITVGAVYDGIVKKLVEFGYFVELVPGQDGLVHISTVPRSDQENFKKRYKEGDKVSVVVLDYDSVTGRIRLKIAE